MTDALHPAVLFLTPDTDVPTGGIRVIYRSVELLNEAGITAAVLHERPGFRCSWFESTAPVTSMAVRPVSEHDVLVVPEVYGPNLHELAPGTPKVVINQNAFLTFEHWPIPRGGGDVTRAQSPYGAPDVVATLVVSDQNQAYLEHAFPGLQSYRIVYDMDVPITAPDGKDDVIAFMPRKNRDHALQVLSILSLRGVLDDWEVVAIDGVEMQEAYAILRRSKVFLSFGYPEGCGLPPLEAMGSGCVVVGYDGGGGVEYLTSDTGYPVPYGDIVTFAREVEQVLGALRTDPGPVVERVHAGQRLIRERYNSDNARESITGAWRRILDDLGAGQVAHDAPMPADLHLTSVTPDPELGRLRAELDAVRAERDLAVGEREIADAQRDAAMAQRDGAAARVDELESSHSWRVTRPLRRLHDRLRPPG